MIRILPAFLLAAICSVLLLGMPGNGWCGFSNSDQTIEDSSPQEVVGGMANKAVRGVANITTGWLEFPKQIYETSKEDGIAKGVFVGPVKGLGMALVRTVSGVCETLTFFVAYPGFYDPYVEPAYVWQKE